MLNMWIFVLEIAMLHETCKKSKELELYSTELSLKHAHNGFVHGFFTSSFTTKCGFDIGS